MKERENKNRLKIAANQKLKERDYWLKKLSGNLEKSVIPYDYIQKNTAQSGTGELREHAFSLREDSFQTLMKFSKGVDHTLNMILVALLDVLLH
ncbi:MAG: hypothetical protein GY757_22610, partial [bacterium]|nr:hypothetical protein [bacterium]